MQPSYLDKTFTTSQQTRHPLFFHQNRRKMRCVYSGRFIFFFSPLSVLIKKEKLPKISVLFPREGLFLKNTVDLHCVNVPRPRKLARVEHSVRGVPSAAVEHAVSLWTHLPGSAEGLFLLWGAPAQSVVDITSAHRLRHYGHTVTTVKKVK